MRLRLFSALLVVVMTSLACATTGSGAGTETHERQLLHLHEAALRAHLESDVDLLLEAESDQYVLVSRGEVSHPTLEERRAFFGPYLQQTRFHVYRDLVPPTVRVSEDGSLGWVVAQIEARGEQTTSEGTVRPLAFVSAWIELCERRNGRWVRVGNVSNFKAPA